MTDEEIVPFDSLPQKKQDLLQNSTLKIYLTIENSAFDQALNCTIYNIEVGIQKDQNVHTHHVHKRYSALNQFDELVRPFFKDSRALQPFPPKKFIGNKDDVFVNQRTIDLQNYILSLLKVPEIVNTPAFIRFFEIDPNLLANL